MPDREKVIKGLEQFIADFKPFCGNKADWQRVYDALALLKAQEPPTSESISSAIECLLHPQDADDSDMAKAIDTAVRAMRLLKAQEPKAVIGVTEIYKDIWLGNCPSCDQSIVSNINKPTKYCRFCGQAVKWE